jgi:hypothetical protein
LAQDGLTNSAALVARKRDCFAAMGSFDLRAAVVSAPILAPLSAL